MKENKKTRAIKNIVYSTLVKVLTFVIGIIIPRLIIAEYGSETNGLLQTIGSIYSYMSLIVAGVSAAAAQGLYKPLAEDDKEGISSILVATRKYYRRLIRFYGLGVLCLTFIYPWFIKTGMNIAIICGVIFLEGFSTVLTYYFTSTVQTLLSADGRDYAMQIIQFAVFILTSIAKISLILLGANIVILQTSYLVINCLQITAYQIYVKKTYPWINWMAEPNHSVLSKRKHFLLNGVAWTVFNSTDTLIISTFCGLMFSSVYALYNMVFANLNIILTVFYSSIYFILGQAYHEDKEQYVDLHDGMETCISALVFSLLSIAYILVLPFFKLYTRGITDINYIDKYLPLLFCLVQILSNCRMISGNLINLTNNPQLTNKASIAEVIINIVVSITLTKIMGLYGVLIGTIVALAFKTNFIIVVSNKKLLKRNPINCYLTHGTNLLLFFGVVLFTKYVDLGIANYGQLLLWGIALCVIVIPLYFGINFFVNPKSAKYLKLLLKRKS